MGKGAGCNPTAQLIECFLPSLGTCTQSKSQRWSRVVLAPTGETLRYRGGHCWLTSLRKANILFTRLLWWRF